jgi:RHS repeat-associated protein
VVSENGVRKTYSARYYNPATGRFLSRDPEAGEANDPKTLHKYLYAGGDPVDRIDPMGRHTIETLFTDTDIRSSTEIAATNLGKWVAKTLICAALDLALGKVFPQGVDTSGLSAKCWGWAGQ